MDFVIANLTVQLNADFSFVFRFIDPKTKLAYVFTGSTFKCEVRPSPGSATLTKSLTAALDTTDIANGRVGINWAKGDIALGTYYYDLLRVTAGKQRPIMKGSLTIIAGVTA